MDALKHQLLGAYLDWNNQIIPQISTLQAGKAVTVLRTPEFAAQ